MRVDKLTMANAVEARVPFLDHELVELAMAIPRDEKIRDGVGKHVLKRAVRRLLPRRYAVAAQAGLRHARLAVVPRRRSATSSSASSSGRRSTSWAVLDRASSRPARDFTAPGARSARSSSGTCSTSRAGSTTGSRAGIRSRRDGASAVRRRSTAQLRQGRPRAARDVGARRMSRRPLLHTGQHYDHALSGAFLDQLSMPRAPLPPRRRIGLARRADRRVLTGVERTLSAEPFDAVLVAGDVNSTLAAALAAAKLRVGVIHLESGLRSGDWTMPEEINRVLTDRLASLLLCHSNDAVDNLAAEGIAGAHVVLAGNTMIDSLFALRGAAERRASWSGSDSSDAGMCSQRSTVRRSWTIHEALGDVLEVLSAVAARLPVVLPLHPRTRARLDRGPADRAPSSRATRVSRVHRPRGRGANRRDGFRRGPGRDLGARRAVHHVPDHDRAAYHRAPRHQPPGGTRAGSSACSDRGRAGATDAAASVRDPALGRASGDTRGRGDRRLPRQQVTNSHPTGMVKGSPCAGSIST